MSDFATHVQADPLWVDVGRALIVIFSVALWLFIAYVVAETRKESISSSNRFFAQSKLPKISQQSLRTPPVRAQQPATPTVNKKEF